MSDSKTTHDRKVKEERITREELAKLLNESCPANIRPLSRTSFTRKC